MAYCSSLAGLASITSAMPVCSNHTDSNKILCQHDTLVLTP